MHIDLGAAREWGRRWPVTAATFTPEPPLPKPLAESRTMRGSGAAGLATVGATGVEVAEAALAETQAAVEPLVPYLVQRYGRIDRIGSPHKRVFMRTIFPVNRLDQLLNLEERILDKVAIAGRSTSSDGRTYLRPDTCVMTAMMPFNSYSMLWSFFLVSMIAIGPGARGDGQSI